MIRLVALDIDGTLLRPGVHVDTLPEDNIVQAVNALHEAGVIVVLATGRMYPGTAYIGNHLNIQQPMICQQGASVHELDGTLQYGYAIDPEISQQLSGFAEEHNLPMAWFDAHQYFVTEHSEQAQFFADVSRVTLQVDPHPQHRGVPATGIDIISNVDRAKEIHTLLEARYGSRITLLDFTSVTAVHAPGASKGNAVAKLGESLGISSEEILAVGDSVNDVSMLSWAGYSAAPAHCDPYARESAKEILQGDGVDGVAALLNSIARQ